MNKKESDAIIVAMFFIIISLVVYAVLKHKIGIEESVAYPFILLMPVLVYLVFADKLTSFKAGGVEATFKEVANEKVKIESGSINELSRNDIDVIDKSDFKRLNEQVSRLKENSSNGKIILTLKFGNKNYYTYIGVKKYIGRLSPFREFKFVVIVDKNEKVIAFIDKEKLTNILSNTNLGEEFIRVVSEGETSSLELFPGLIENKIDENTKNIDALKKMDENKIDELIVCDKKGKLKGVIEREVILSKLMIALAE